MDLLMLRTLHNRIGGPRRPTLVMLGITAANIVLLPPPLRVRAYPSSNLTVNTRAEGNITIFRLSTTRIQTDSLPNS